MAKDLENGQVTKLHVRMNCIGCVQRIKKTIYSVDGVYNLSADISKQKLTVVGRADPETLVKAIKKTRKTAIIYSHTEPSASEPSSEAPPPEPEPTNDPPPQENSAPEESKPSPEPQEPTPVESKKVEEVQHMVHQYPQGHVIREQGNNYPPMTHQAPYHVTHSYNTYRPSPYVTEYGYLQSPPRDVRYNSVETNNYGYYHNCGSEEYYQSRDSDHGNHYNSMFSDENPNACNIV